MLEKDSYMELKTNYVYFCIIHMYIEFDIRKLNIQTKIFLFYFWDQNWRMYLLEGLLFVYILLMNTHILVLFSVIQPFECTEGNWFFEIKS